MIILLEILIQWFRSYSIEFRTHTARRSSFDADFCSQIGICRCLFEINTAYNLSKCSRSFCFQDSQSFQIFSSLKHSRQLDYFLSFVLPVTRRIYTLITINHPFGHDNRSRISFSSFWNKIIWTEWNWKHNELRQISDRISHSYHQIFSFWIQSYQKWDNELFLIISFGISFFFLSRYM